MRWVIENDATKTFRTVRKFAFLPKRMGQCNNELWIGDTIVWLEWYKEEQRFIGGIWVGRERSAISYLQH